MTCLSQEQSKLELQLRVVENQRRIRLHRPPARRKVWGGGHDEQYRGEAAPPFPMW